MFWPVVGLSIKQYSTNECLIILCVFKSQLVQFQLVKEMNDENSFNCLQEEVEQVLKLQYFLRYVSVAHDKVSTAFTDLARLRFIAIDKIHIFDTTLVCYCILQRFQF